MGRSFTKWSTLIMDHSSLTPLVCLFINLVFNENRVIVMLKSAAGGWAGGRACVNFWFPFNNFSLLWTIDTKVTVTKNRNSVSAQLLLFALAYWHQTCCMGSLLQDAVSACYPGVCDQGQGHCY